MTTRSAYMYLSAVVMLYYSLIIGTRAAAAPEPTPGPGYIGKRTEDPRCAAVSCDALQRPMSTALGKQFASDPTTCANGTYCPKCLTDTAVWEPLLAQLGFGQATRSMIPTLIINNWLSTEIIDNIANIILQEAMGFTVDTAPMSIDGNTEILCCKDNLIELEKWDTGTFVDDDGYFDLKHSAIGYVGASGLFVPGYTLDAYPLATAFNAYNYLDEYKNILPKGMSTDCRKLIVDQDLGCVEGNYICDKAVASGRWTNTTCTQGRYIPPQCEAAPQNCSEIFFADPTWDAGYFEGLIKNTGLPFIATYLGGTNLFEHINAAAANNTPVMFYWWEPDPRVSSLNAKAVTFLPYNTECEQKRKVDPTLSKHDCGYPQTNIQKWARRDTLSQDVDLEYFFDKVQLKTSDLNAILKLHKFAGGDQQVWNLTCDWVRNNYDVWKEWAQNTPPVVANVTIVETDNSQVIGIAIGVPIGILLLVALTIPIFLNYRAEQQRKVRVAKKSTELAQNVVAQLRRYNTERVQELVEEAKLDDESNKDLLDSFEALVSNLERYRPFLPNYLFLESDEEEGQDACADDDDEGSIHQETKSSTDHRSHRGSIHHGSKSSAHRSHRNSVYSGTSFTPPERAVTSHRTSKVHPSSTFATASHVASTHYRGLVAFAKVSIQCNEWFSIHFSGDKSDRQQRHTLAAFTDSLYEVAKSSKASVHSLVGDVVQLSWNATHRVLQPEAKGAVFLLNLRSALTAVLPTLELAGACCSGVAEVHSIFSATTKQQALYIDTPWLPALEACYALATQHKTLVVDTNTVTGAEYEVVAQGVDCVRYTPRVSSDSAVAMGPGARSMPGLCPTFRRPVLQNEQHQSLVGEGLMGAGSTTQCSPLPPPTSAAEKEQDGDGTPHQNPERYTLVFELLKQRAARADDEWMYLLQSEEEGNKSGESEQQITTTALRLAVQGKFGEAIEVWEGPVNPQRQGDTKSVVTENEEEKLTPLAALLLEYCHQSLRAHAV